MDSKKVNSRQVSSNSISLDRMSVTGFPIKLILLLATILVVAVFFVVSGNIREEGSRMQLDMKTHADVLIWALEGSSRTIGDQRGGGHGFERQPGTLQMLLEEVSVQPGIVYLAITNKQGRILGHSNPDLIGTSLYNSEQMKAWIDLEESSAHPSVLEGKNVFEVVKKFTPKRLPVRGHGSRGHGQPKHALPRHYNPSNAPESGAWMGNAGRGQGGQRFGKPVEYLDRYVFVGIDPEPSELFLADSIRSSIILGVAVILICVGGLVLFSLIQNFRASRIHYYNARSLTLQLFDHLPMGLVAVDTDGIVLIDNQQAAEMIGFPTDKKGRIRREVKLTDYPGLDWNGLMQELLQGQVIVDRELEIGARANDALHSKLSISLTGEILKDYTGSNAGYLFVLRDLEEVNQLKEQVRLGERLSELGNMAAGVAHEIRNPLSSIKGYLSLLDEKIEDPVVKDATRLMSDEVERLNKVVSGLLGVARAGKLNIEKQPLLEVAERALRLVEAEATQKNVQVRLETSLSFEESIAPLDKDKLLQALLNILINAIQASPPGGEVLVELVQDKGENTRQGGLFRLSIEDSGPGMSYDVQSKIFTPYFTTKPEGTGLGLTITHQIVEQHQGCLEVASLPGKGSKLTLVIPGAN